MSKMQRANSLIDFALFSHISCCAKARLWVSQKKKKKRTEKQIANNFVVFNSTIKQLKQKFGFIKRVDKG